MGDVYRQEVIALRAELARRDGPPPVPSLEMYANDPQAFLHAIERRGIHPREAGVVALIIADLLAQIKELGGGT
jgi:hypothetical protein